MLFFSFFFNLNAENNQSKKTNLSYSQKILSKENLLNQKLYLNIFSGDTNSIFYDDLELSVDNWTFKNGWVLSTIEYSSPVHSFYHSVGKNENDTLLTPNYLLPQIDIDIEKLYLSFDILVDMPDSDSDNDGFLEDYYRIWLKDMDGSINGYSNERLDYLETPLIELNQNDYELSFKLLHKLERNNLNLPYDDNGCIVDGWDAANVQISEDNGFSWQILNGLPEYNCKNCFGFRFNTGDCNTPGWTDIINDWTDAKFDLSDYSGKNIKIRFAFASDPGFSSVDDEQKIITGFYIDEIVISNNSDTLLYDNADESIVLIPNDKSNWNVNEFNGYDNSNSWWAGKELKSPHYQITYDYGSENRPGSSSVWETYGPGSSFNEETNMSLDLSNWNGKNIKIGWEFITDNDDDDGIGEGMYIDNIHIWKKSLIDIPNPPKNLVAKSINNAIYLSWDKVISDNIDGLISYDDGSFEDGIFLQSGELNGTLFDIPFGVSAKLNKISIFSVDTVSNVSLFGYNIIGGEPEDSPIYQIDVSNIIYDSWNQIDVDWNFNNDFMIAQKIDSMKYISIDLSSVPSQNSWIERNGVWERWKTVSELDNLSDGEWGIRVDLETSNAQFPFYNVYRKDESSSFNTPLFNGTYISENMFIDSLLEPNLEYSYAVSSVYNIGSLEQIESILSETVSIKYQRNSVTEIKYDSGISSTGVSPLGEGSWYAVRFTPSSYPVKILSLQFFSIQEGGNAYLGVFENDSILNIPKNQLGNTLIIANIDKGWNTKDVSAADILINKGDFYIAWGETPNLSPLGIDLSENILNKNRSYYYTISDGWNPVASLGYDGNLLIRAFVNNLDGMDSLGITKEIFPYEFNLMQNYPNPFNIYTNIKFQIPNDSKVEINIYDILGNKVLSKNFGLIKKGIYIYKVEGKDLSSGLYFYRMEADNFINSKKFILLK